jgi:L-lactate dehydrogenase complex protein LldF
MSLFVFGLGLMGKLFGRFRWLPLAGGWTRHRDFPAPDVQTFQAQWKRRARVER